MIEHLVLIRWQPGIERHQINDVLAQARKMSGIDGVLDVSILRNLEKARPEQGKGINDILRITIADEEALAGFGPAPLHREFAKSMLPIADDITIVDIPIDPAGSISS